MPSAIVTPAEAAARLAALKHEVAQAAVVAGRKPEDINVIGVSKTFPPESVEAYLQAGLTVFGESYIQEAVDKAAIVKAGSTPPSWHFIGHLQRNKAKYAAPVFSALHSLDNLGLAAELEKHLSRLNRRMDIFVQVNVSGEASKSGLAPGDLTPLLAEIPKYPSLILRGLMTMPPYDQDPEVSRPYFAALRKLRDEVAPQLKDLSMGMSGDFKVAIEEGATFIRVGTSLFGAR